MSKDEIEDWMAYEISISKDFIERQKQKELIANSKEDEAKAIRELFASIGC